LLVERERRKEILAIALPILGGMVSQNIMNLVDTGMVGRWGGDPALAAVGMGSFINFMAVAFLMGMSVGVQAIASRRKGEARLDEMAHPLNGGLALALGIGLPFGLLLFWLAGDIFGLLNDDQSVVAMGTPYLQARLCAMIGVGANFSFRGYWNAINMSALYMRTIIVIHLVNIFLNWVFIFGNLGAPELGAMGAGVATAIATYVGTAYYFYLGFKHARENGFLDDLPSRKSLWSMLKLAGPTGVQRFFFAAGMTCFFWIVGLVGRAELAAANVLINLLLVGILPGIGFGMAGASLVGQALGRGDKEDATRWGWEVMRLTMLVVALVGIPGLLFPDLILGIFITNPDTLALARLPLQLVAGTLFLDTAGLVLLSTLQGAGDTRRTMLISIVIQWAFLLPLAYLVGPALKYGLLGIWIVLLVRDRQRFAVRWTPTTTCMLWRRDLMERSGSGRRAGSSRTTARRFAPSPPTASRRCPTEAWRHGAIPCGLGGRAASTGTTALV